MNNKVLKWGVLLGVLPLSVGCGDSGTSGSTAANVASTSGSTSLSMSTGASSVSPNSSTSLSASGGSSPYTFSLYSGVGSVSGNTFQAGSSTGSANIKVVDAAGSVAYGYVSVVSTVVLSVSASSIATGGTVTLTASGGLSPYTYSKSSGGGSVSGNIYTAPVYGTSAVVLATDANGATASASISVTYSAPLEITPSSTTIYVGELLTLSTSGGTGSYSYAKISGLGSLSGATYTASSSATTAQIQVWDTDGSTAVATISVVAKTKLNRSANFQLDDGALIVFGMPESTALYPVFAVGGKGPGGDFGRNVNRRNGADYQSFAPAPASAAIALSNFNWSDGHPYLGSLSVSGRAGSDRFDFCIQAGDSVAYLRKAQVAIGVSMDYGAITFGSFVGQTSVGTNIAGLSVNKLDPGAGAGAGTIQVLNGIHDHGLTDCSGYTDFQLLSASSQ